MSAIFKDNTQMINGVGAGMGVAAVGGAILARDASQIMANGVLGTARIVGDTYTSCRQDQEMVYTGTASLCFLIAFVIMGLSFFDVTQVSRIENYAVAALIFGQTMHVIGRRHANTQRILPGMTRGGYQFAWCVMTLVCWSVLTYMFVAGDFRGMAVNEAILYSALISVAFARVGYIVTRIYNYHAMVTAAMDRSNTPAAQRHQKRAKLNGIFKPLRKQIWAGYIKSEISSLVICFGLIMLAFNIS